MNEKIISSLLTGSLIVGSLRLSDADLSLFDESNGALQRDLQKINYDISDYDRGLSNELLNLETHTIGITEISNFVSSVNRDSQRVLELSENDLSRVRQSSENLKLMRKALDKLNYAYAGVELKNAEISQVLADLKSNNDRVKASLSQNTALLFENVEVVVQNFIKITENEIKDLKHFPILTQLEILVNMSERTELQIGIIEKIAKDFVETRVLDNEKFIASIELINSNYAKLVAQNNELILLTINSAKAEMMNAFQNSGLPPACASFYYNKLLLSSIFESVIIDDSLSQVEKADVTMKIDSFKKELSLISYYDRDSVSKIISMAADMKTTLVVALGIIDKLGDIKTATDMLKSGGEAVTDYEQLQVDAYNTCMFEMEKKIKDDLTNGTSAPLIKLDNPIPLGDLPPYAPNTGPSISQGGNVQTKGAIETAKSLANASKMCCDKYDAGAVDDCAVTRHDKVSDNLLNFSKGNGLFGDSTGGGNNGKGSKTDSSSSDDTGCSDSDKECKSK